MELSEVARIPR